MGLANYYFGVYSLTYITPNHQGTSTGKVTDDISIRYQYGEGD
jgi:hypothetical protein